MKVRDIFDVAVVDALHHDLLNENLRYVSHLKSALLARLETVSESFLHHELGELAIAEEWRKSAATCLFRVRHIVDAIPAAPRTLR